MGLINAVNHHIARVKSFENAQFICIYIFELFTSTKEGRKGEDVREKDREEEKG